MASPWSKKEVEFLKKNYGRITTDKLEKKLNRSKEGIHHKSRILKIKWLSRKWKDKIDYEKKNKNSIVDYRDVINTYSKYHQDRAYSYITARKLKFGGVRTSEISKQLKISKFTIEGWSYKSKPFPLRSIEELNELNLLPFIPVQNSRVELIVKLFAYILTDGTINKNNLSNIKIAGDYEDLLSLKKEINNIFPRVSCSIHKWKSKGNLEGRKIEGLTNALEINNTALGRLLYVLGAPIGDKVIQSFKLPNWIFELNRDLKRIFLGVLWSCEGSKPLIHKKGYNLNFGMSKDERLKKEHKFFLNQIRYFFQEFNIDTSNIAWSNKRTLRKDKIISRKAYFYVRSYSKNFLKFYHQIPLFAKKKQEFFKAMLNNVMNIEKRKEQRKKLRKDILNDTLKLLEGGYSKNYISNELKIPRSTLRYWLNLERQKGLEEEQNLY